MSLACFTEPDELLSEALRCKTIHPKDGSHAFREHLLCVDDYWANNNSGAIKSPFIHHYANNKPLLHIRSW